MLKQILKQRQNKQSFRIGDIVQLVYSKGIHAVPGTLAEVMPFSDFPDLYDQMLGIFKKEEIEDYFIAVRWFPSPYGQNIEMQNGFYTIARFTKVRPTSLA